MLTSEWSTKNLRVAHRGKCGNKTLFYKLPTSQIVLGSREHWPSCWVPATDKDQSISAWPPRTSEAGGTFTSPRAVEQAVPQTRHGDTSNGLSITSWSLPQLCTIGRGHRQRCFPGRQDGPGCPPRRRNCHSGHCQNCRHSCLQT